RTESRFNQKHPGRGAAIPFFLRRPGKAGGGRPDMAQAGVKDPALLGQALAAVGGALTAG
ncbi:MAG TPA: hypothetical protein PLT07_03520, partial [Trueperaceae bacterium]|nr:hypothetical protein [Trueperaceae bacterium]